MKLVAFIVSLFGLFLRCFFGKSDQERIGEAEERLRNIEKQKKVKKVIESAKKIRTKKELIKKMKSGTLVLVVFILSACASDSVDTVFCQDIKYWTQDQQAEMIKHIELLPKNSILVDVLVDYANMREKAKMCNNYY